ncbi:hypothetical protein LQW54_000104 [Pestalotiopsis sp. IQ-011]
MDAEIPDPDPYFLHVKFDKRWECHKSTIVRLFVDEDKSMKELSDQMKTQYRFDASVRQYRYQLKKWNIAKNLTSTAKEKTIHVLGKRARDGAETGEVRYNGVEVDKKRLRRYLQSSARQQSELRLSGIVFGRWNLPYEALRNLFPLEIVAATPSEVSVSSPRMSSPTQRNAQSPGNAPSPTTAAIVARTHNQRAKYLLGGQLQDLFSNMSVAESKTITDWLHHFWLFSFTTAKYWGKGPTRWSWKLLNFKTLADVTSSPNSPGIVEGSTSHINDSATNRGSSSSTHIIFEPPMLCRWTIHHWDPEYDRLDSPPDHSPDQLSMDAPETWPDWTRDESSQSLAGRLTEAIEQNSFSNVQRTSLPVSATQIVEAVNKSPEELELESLGFAIMAQNEELTMGTLKKLGGNEHIDMSKIYPFHLAANYLAGGKTCCNIFTELVSKVEAQNSIGRLYINEMGYTVLDSLMLSILKSHTSCIPTTVDARAPKGRSFDGEEVDMCGRWDADSACVISLHKQGHARIPSRWKHVFCHTSAQTICHSIIAIFRENWSPDINTPSGLFLKYCRGCNKKLELLPLHTLTLVAFHLGRDGTEGETLFGAIACLLCLIMHGADPLREAELSIPALIGIDGEECSHLLMTPAELAKNVPRELLTKWSEDARLGWDVFVGILQYAADERSASRLSAPSEVTSDVARSNARGDSPESIEDEEVQEESLLDCDHIRDNYFEFERRNFFGKSLELGKLWAAVQTELLTYRRIEASDAWISSHFSMRAVLETLGSPGLMDELPFFKDSMLKRFCVCGRFEEAWDGLCPTVQEACEHYFSNMEDWSRSTFIKTPGVIRGEEWE